MRYCTRCILPDSRPNLTLGTDGVCNACCGISCVLRGGFLVIAPLLPSSDVLWLFSVDL